ncbi:MAG: molybdopterin-binding protein, partial [SAR202 cluster bacterium]|nr:molybdopterin-binding protein [SAR202 cluster bacterium]
MSELQAHSTRRLAILTISDAGSRGDRQDTSGPTIADLMENLGYVVTDRAMVTDEVDQISDQLVAWCDGGEVDVILTTGGTGLSPRDVTPEA